MSAIEKIRLLIDKQNGVGLSKTLIAKYCGRNHSSLDYYLIKGAEPTPAIEELYEAGLQQLLNDIKEIIEN